MEKRILSLFAAAAIILSVLPGCGAQYPGFSEEVSNAPEALSAYIHDSIDALAELGIDISDNEEEITGEIIDLFGDPASCSDKGTVLSFILTDVSFLETDAPVLAWDTEVFELEGMYTDFLKAVDTLSGGELDISRIEEDNSGVDWDKGSGRKNVSFTVMGADCDFSAAFEGDWMNVDIVKCVNDKLEDLGAGKRLLACFDGYQGIILFYNTPEWCESFNAAFPELPLGTSVDVSAGPLGFLFW